MLLASEEMQQFDRARVFLDEDFTAVEKFTVSTEEHSVDDLYGIYFLGLCFRLWRVEKKSLLGLQQISRWLKRRLC